MSRIVVLGSINLDLSASVSRLPAPGETVTGATLSRFPGGKGGNQALAARRLGAEVTLLAAVGADSAADEATALLCDGGVDLASLQVLPDSSTGVALIAVAASGENQIVVAPGANALLELGNEELPAADALICQLEVPESTIAAAAKMFDGFFSINLAPAKPIDDSILARADLVIVNETEAAWYGERLSLCGGYVATTYGAEGAELSRDGERVARSDAFVVDAVDTVAAGDTFTAALTIALLEEMRPADALRFACAAGALATTKHGAQTSLPHRTDVEAML